MKKRKQETCTCEAHKFPHRLYGGDCYGHDLADCPNIKTVTDPYGTGDLSYHWIEHGCYEACIKEEKQRNMRGKYAYARKVS